MRLINLTPHAIVLAAADGQRTTLPPSGSVARLVSASAAAPVMVDGIPVPVASSPVHTGVEGLPAPEAGVGYLVSGFVLAYLGQTRPDVFAPGTGPEHKVIRNNRGQVEAVTCLVRG